MKLIDKKIYECKLNFLKFDFKSLSLSFSLINVNSLTLLYDHFAIGTNDLQVLILMVNVIQNTSY